VSFKKNKIVMRIDVMVEFSIGKLNVRVEKSGLDVVGGADMNDVCQKVALQILEEHGFKYGWKPTPVAEEGKKS
jgi:hypothetical protein